jgi:hypothetical protein
MAEKLRAVSGESQISGRRDFWEPSLGANWDALWQTQPDNVFLVKLSYWLSP